ncbi:MAG: response regulator [Thermoplasmatota archaeon]
MSFDDIARRVGFRPGSRRSFALLVVLAVTYLSIAAWILATGWFRIMASAPIRPEAVALYVALVLLTAVPLAVRFLYSSVLMQQLARAAQVLRSARDAAQDAARTKAEFLATMSHEIRSPLNAVIGFSELLVETPLDQRQREYATSIRESSTHLHSIINDVLDYSKIEAGRVELEEKAVEVGPLVESCVKTVSLAAAGRGLELGFLLGPGTPPTLFGDATRIRQVLLNLLSNAVKFTERGEVRLITRGVREPDGRHLVVFEVHDTGIGISEAGQKRLFNAFTQLDPSSTRSHGGTGLGLAISHRLCRLMGGALTVKSRPGRGSTFVATLRAPAAPDPPQTPTPKALRGLRLLVIDDSAMNRAILARNAQAWGMETRATGDPSKALSWIRAGDPFDVAILGHGHRKPGFDAFRLAERIRSTGRGFPLLLASQTRDLPANGIIQPFAGHVTKPLVASALLDAFLAALGVRAQEAVRPRRPRAERSLRILLVEDNVMNRKLALRVLERLGHRSDVAENGAKAVDAVLRKRYDVVLMDVQMPVMDGIEATRTIHRRLPRSRRPVIIGLSANALPGDREQCLRAGMDEYTPKPMDQDRLATLLTAAGQRARPAHTTGRRAA